ncbi:Uncharacterized protein GBIM_01765 [Gryllus bimaculatus]|nr:Uncharacterized protein GBIM_01765 [Gryllus bimaculatus]
MASYLQSSAKMLMFYIMLFSITYATHDLAYPISRTLRLTRKTRQVNAISTSHIDNKRPTTIQEGLEELATHATDMSTKIDILKNAFKQQCPIYQMSQFSTEYFLSPTTYIHSDIKEIGADVNAIDAAGDTPLTLSMLGNHINASFYLLSNGASPNTKYENGDTLLLRALKDNRLDMANKLLNYGASISLKGKTGESPLTLIAEKGDTEILRTMLNYAKPSDTQELVRALQVAKDGVVVWVFADTVPYLFLGQPGENALLQSTKRCQERGG